MYLKLDSIMIGPKNVVRRTSHKAIPSMPTRYETPNWGIQSWVSTN